MKNKYCVIGDIHGEFNQLKGLIDMIPKDRILIFLGDYVNKGLDSKKVIDYLLFCKNEYECQFLLGNHDYYFLQYIDNKLDFSEFAGLGGLGTLKSYLRKAFGDVHKQLIANLPQEHLDFLFLLKPFYEDETYFFSHSGINTKKPQSRKKMDLINNEDFWGQLSLNDKVIICGHFIQSKQLPFVSPNLIGIDTGCGTINGPLTCYLLPENIYYQYSNPHIVQSTFFL